jgi:hypothetical protein
MTGWIKRRQAGLRTAAIGVLLVTAVMLLGPAPTAQAQSNCYMQYGYIQPFNHYGTYRGCYIREPSGHVYWIWPYGYGSAYCDRWVCETNPQLPGLIAPLGCQDIGWIYAYPFCNR